MISDYDAQIAVRNRLSTLLVAISGPATMAASANGGVMGYSAFTRTSGSFITDKLRVGLEVLASGFTNPANNGYATIVAVSADGLTLSINKKLQTEAAGAARLLTVGLPELVSWENVKFDHARAQGRPFVDEQYIPGPADQYGMGQGGLIRVRPTSVYTFYVPFGYDIGADSAYIDAMRILFAPGQPITLPGQQEPMKVRRDASPFKSQRSFAVEGWAAAPFTIPFELFSPNTI